MTGTSYRLPDWLGGHEVRLVEGDWEPDCAVVELRSGPKVGERMTVDPEWIVNVRPPSIDDPVSWPLELITADGWLVRLRDVRCHDEERAAIELRAPGGDVASDVMLFTRELRTLARAAWQEANRREATP